MKVTLNKVSFLIILFSISFSSFNVIAASANDKCEALFFEHSDSLLVYPKDAFVSYNMGIVSGVPGTPPGGSTYFPALERVQKYNQAGLVGYRVVKERDAYYLPGDPGTPGRPPNINSDDPKVIVTAQARGYDFMNVTVEGPRNSVLAQIIKTSQTPAKDLKQFQEMFPIAFSGEELPAAIELKNKIDQAALLQAQQESQKQSDELKRRAEEVRAQEVLSEQRVAILEENQRQDRLRQENAARVLEEEKYLAIKEKNLSGFEDSVEISVEFDTSSTSFRGSGMGRSTVSNATDVKDIEASIKKIKSGLSGITSSEMSYQLKTTLFLNRPTTKAYKMTLHLKGSRKEVVQLIARGVALFPPGMGGGTARQMLEKILTSLDSAFPPKTPVKKWQDLVIKEANPYFYGESPSPQNRGYRGGQGAGSPVWDGVPGSGSPVWGG